MSRLIRSAGVVVLTSVICWCMSSSALALPNGRVYELVSPVYKEGYGVRETTAVEPEGETVAFTSKGGFSGALSGGIFGSHYYLARRGASGWSTGSLEPSFGGLSDVSANLEYALASGPLGPNAGVESHTSVEEVFQLHSANAPDTPESWEIFGGIVFKRLDGEQTLVLEEGASADLCHVVLSKTEGALLSAAENTTEPIYDLSRGCDGEPASLRLIGLKNNGTPTPISRSCTVALGTGNYLKSVTGNEQEDNFNAVSADGSEIFFTTNVSEGTGCETGAHQQLFMRVGGNRTIEVSRPLETSEPFGGCVAQGIPGEVPCEGEPNRASAYFVGASEDGSRVFFTTTAPLVSGDEDNESDLYMATIGCPGVEPSAETQSCEPSQREVTSLVQVSHSPVTKEAAEVQGVVRLAPDGSRIYFVARGVLSEGANVQGLAPVMGADNLYVYNSASHKTAFVADLCSGPERSGVVEEVRCPRDLSEDAADAELLWRSNRPEAQSTRDGVFLVFCTYAQLVPGDTDEAKDVYRYDAETGALERVSVGEDSYHANGNEDAFDANIERGYLSSRSVSAEHEMAVHAISEDGSRIVFYSAEPLSPDATNGRVNIYEWHDGSVSLISSGTSEEDDIEPVITASGRDIFFTTSQGLVHQDNDGLLDIYDARMGGGFPLETAERQPCSGDACQGPLTNPAPLLVPGSASQAPGENFSIRASKPAVKTKLKKPQKKKQKNKKKKKKKGKASGTSGKVVKAAGRRGL